MTAERYKEIINCIILMIQDEMRSIFGQKLYYQRKEMYNSVGYSCFCFQVYYDKEYDKFYLYYELDPIARSYDYIRSIKRINSRLNSNFQRETNHKIEIVGPAILLGPKSLPRVANQSEIVLRSTVFSYWKCFDNYYRFLEDKQRLMLDHNIFYDTDKYKDNLEKERNFKSSLFSINKKYNFNSSSNEKDVRNAFIEYKELYNDLYGKVLNPVGSKDITYVFMDAIYPDLTMLGKK